MAGVFISYRREDTGEYWARRIAEIFGREFGGHQVYFDVASIGIGKDFRQEIQDYIRKADVVVVVMGRDFFAMNCKTGKRRIDEVDDPVRLEVKTALGQKKLTLPVLTDCATQPAPAEFPEDIRELAYNNFFELNTLDDLDNLVSHLEPHIQGGAEYLNLSTKKTILKSSTDRSLVNAKARTTLTVRLIEMGWLLDDRYGESALSNPNFQEFRFRFQKKNALLVLEKAKVWKPFRIDRVKWEPVAVFIVLGGLSDKSFHINMPDRIRQAAANPKKFLAKNGRMSRRSYKKVMKKDLPGLNLLPAWGLMKPEERVLVKKRVKAHTARQTPTQNLKIENIGRLYMSQGSFTAVAFHPRSNLLAAATTAGEVQLWSMDDLNPEPAVLNGHQKVVQCLAFARDGRLASGAADGKIKVWDTEHRTEQQEFRRTGLIHRLINKWEDSIDSISWSPDGRLLLSASKEKAIWLWDTHTGEASRSISHESDCLKPAAAFHPNGRSLVASEYSFLVWYNPVSGNLLEKWPHSGNVNELAFSPDSTLLAVAGDKGTIYLYDVSSGNRIDNLVGHEPVSDGIVSVEGIAFSPTGRWLASMGTDGRLIIWEVHSRQISNFLRWENDYFSGMGSPGLAWSSDGKFVALPAAGGQVQILAVAE